MRLLITSLLALLCAIGLGLLLARDSGRMILVWGEWTIQTSTSLFALALMLAALAAYFTIHLVADLIRFPRNLRHWSARRRIRRSEQLLIEGLVAMVEHDWHTAERFFQKGAAHSPAPVLNHLFAARAAQCQGAAERRDRYLRQAREQDRGAELATGLARAEILLDARQTGLAYASLRELDAGEPGHDPVKRLMLEAGAELQDWPLVLEILERLEARRLLPPERIRTVRFQAHAGLLRDAGASGDVQRLEAQWGAIPKRLRRDNALLDTYVQERLKFPDSAACEELLRRAIRQGWNANLVALYGRVAGRDPAAQLRTAQAWLAGHERDPVLLLTLGRLARRCELWGKARSYLEECVALQPGPEAFRELGAVLEEMGEQDAAAKCYQRGLSLATGA